MPGADVHGTWSPDSPCNVQSLSAEVGRSAPAAHSARVTSVAFVEPLRQHAAANKLLSGQAMMIEGAPSRIKGKHILAYSGCKRQGIFTEPYTNSKAAHKVVSQRLFNKDSEPQKFHGPKRPPGLLGWWFSRTTNCLMCSDVAELPQ